MKTLTKGAKAWNPLPYPRLMIDNIDIKLILSVDNEQFVNIGNINIII